MRVTHLIAVPTTALLFAAGAGPMAAAPTAAALAVGPTCAGRPATIIGTSGADQLLGTPAADVIYADSGDDTIHGGGGGGDVVCGGDGDDTIYGDHGGDVIHGGDGDDTIYGGPGADRLHGGAGNDRLDGGEGPDLITGGPGDDVIAGGPGNDTLHGGEGDDSMAGGADDDTLSGSDGADILQGGDDADHLVGGDGADRLFGRAGDDRLTGGNGDDSLHGGEGFDDCDGGEGEDEAAACEQVSATEIGQTPAPRIRPGAGQVALTFDDGPSAAYTPQILDLLARYQVPATFFVIGRSAEANPGLLRRMAQGGHSVQNHTYGHYWLTRYSDTTIVDQLDRANRVIERSTGERPNCLRPPFGAVNDRVRTIAAADGLATIMWDVDPWDWKHPGSYAVARHVLSRIGGGEIVLFHDTAGWSTIGALPEIIKGLRQRGLEFVTICD